MSDDILARRRRIEDGEVKLTREIAGILLSGSPSDPATIIKTVRAIVAHDRGEADVYEETHFPKWA